MSLVDSEAAFQQRAVQISGNDELYDRLKGADLKTFSDLAFACGTPQSLPDEDGFNPFALGVYEGP